MSWRTNSFILLLRNAGRALGLNRLIATRLYGSGYETRYDEGLSRCIQTGDTVWDIGANVGYYTRQFADRVGSDGRVFAFEPSSVNFARLHSQCASLDNVSLFPIGLGSADGNLSFQQGADDLGATSRVVSPDKGGIVVSIRSGDGLVEKREAEIPQVIKMDVEGYEWEVLDGMRALLPNTALRAVGIEMHFGILKERGMDVAPEQIEALLRQAGFSLEWPDSSHLLAKRKA